MAALPVVTKSLVEQAELCQNSLDKPIWRLYKQTLTPHPFLRWWHAPTFLHVAPQGNLRLYDNLSSQQREREAEVLPVAGCSCPLRHPGHSSSSFVVVRCYSSERKSFPDGGYSSEGKGFPSGSVAALKEEDKVTLHSKPPHTRSFLGRTQEGGCLCQDEMQQGTEQETGLHRVS